MLKPLDLIIYRTPVFSLDDDLNEVWGSLKEKIKESSVSFYQNIADINAEDIGSLDGKIRFTIWKYFNRAKFRATPFGSFAAVTIVPLSKTNGPDFQIASEISMHSFRNWTDKLFDNEDPAFLINSSVYFVCNSSIYKVGNEIRFIRQRNNQFEIASVNIFPELSFILNLCSSPTHKDEIYAVMYTNFKMSRRKVTEILEQMVALQLLLTDKLPNITGADYFTRLNYLTPSSDTLYQIAERKLISGSYNAWQMNNIPALIELLHQILPDTYNDDLNSFKNKFVKKFGVKEVPLSIAMDPEIGVGYGDFANHQADGGLVSSLVSERKINAYNTTIAYTKLHSAILDHLINARPIKLEEFKNINTKSDLKLPNTLNVLLNIWEGHPVIERIGGSTANSLLGRFTMAGREFEALGQQISLVEKSANPGVIFFDIAYQAEKNVDNVNRRKTLYEQELPILTWSCLNEPLNFNDILVSVKDGEVVLRSKKYNKRLVPRIPSAYNYTRSDLAVYRFLCDIQSQGIKTDLNFRLPDYFPNLQHYPRVTFRDIIISPASWKVPSEFFDSKKSAGLLNKRNALTSWLKAQGIESMFKAGNADRVLCFDPNNDNDLDAFLIYCGQQTNNDLYIKEALISRKNTVTDENGKPYSAELIFNYYHENQLYAELPSETNNGIQKPVNEKLLPGSDWLYFEIYSHPVRSNDILLNVVNVFLKQAKSKIKKWFFIRYTDPEPHIRLRIQLNEQLNEFDLIKKLKDLIEPYNTLGLIDDFNIKTYHRETDRYGVHRIDMVESFFFINSKYIISLLNKPKAIEALYADTLHFVKKYFLPALDSFNEQLIFVKKMADIFSNEMKTDVNQFKKINYTYKDVKELLLQQADQVNNQAQKHLKQLAQIFRTCTNNQEKEKLLADLIHMHINRLFISDQRIHEAIIYQYLYKMLMSYRASLSFQSEYLI
jgi:thiopeptide-type bacteriocin biosynthesis protein